PGECHRARGDTGTFGREAEGGHSGDRLAAARLADHADDLAGPDLESDAVDDPRDAAPGRELDRQVADGERRWAIVAGVATLWIAARGGLLRSHLTPSCAGRTGRATRRRAD